MAKLSMHETLPFDEAAAPPRVSTGDLPMHAEIRQIVTEAYERYRGTNSGTVADYIPVLADASPDLFGIAVVGPWGRSFEIGDVTTRFSIQSVSKPFVFALVVDTLGYEAARTRLGVNSTGFPFNSLMAVELNAERTMNPLVNAGAIATTSLAPGDTLEEKWASIRERLSLFAGRELTMNEEVYASESATNLRNQGIAHLLKSYERLYFDPDEATDIYTRQCSLDVTAHDLAVMAATLANGGVNPATGDTVLRPGVCRRVLAVMASAGLYELSGDWLYQIGVPGKSGVSGGIVTVVPERAGWPRTRRPWTRRATASAASWWPRTSPNGSGSTSSRRFPQRARRPSSDRTHWRSAGWRAAIVTETNGEAPYASLRERLAPLCGVVVAVIAQVAMRDRIVLGPLYLAPVIETALVVVLVLVDGVLKAYRNRMGYVWYALALILAGSATTSAVLLIHDVIQVRPVSVQQLLAEGLQILVVLTVGFALMFWQLDRGGPNGRVQPDVERISFWFTQDAIREYSDQFDNWQPRFLDYLYVSITNLIAFSPTDTMPLTRTAKMLMAWESAVSLATFAVVLARAVNILK